MEERSTRKSPCCHNPQAMRQSCRRSTGRSRYLARRQRADLKGAGRAWFGRIKRVAVLHSRPWRFALRSRKACLPAEVNAKLHLHVHLRARRRTRHEPRDAHSTASDPGTRRPWGRHVVQREDRRSHATGVGAGRRGQRRKVVPLPGRHSAGEAELSEGRIPSLSPAGPALGDEVIVRARVRPRCDEQRRADDDGYDEESTGNHAVARRGRSAVLSPAAAPGRGAPSGRLTIAAWTFDPRPSPAEEIAKRILFPLAARGPAVDRVRRRAFCFSGDQGISSTARQSK